MKEAQKSERFGGFDRQHGVCCAGVDDAGELDRGMTLSLDDEVQNGHVARPVFEAPVGHRTAKSAGGDGGGRYVEERDAELLLAECFAQLGFGVGDGDDLAPADGHPLAEVVLHLGREARRVIFAVLGVDLRDGAGGYGEEISHGPSVAPGSEIFQATAGRAELMDEHTTSLGEHTFDHKGVCTIDTDVCKIGAQCLGSAVRVPSPWLHQGPTTAVDVFTRNSNPVSRHATAGIVNTNAKGRKQHD